MTHSAQSKLRQGDPRKNQLPAVHDWMLLAGITLLFVWMGFFLVADLAKPRFPDFALLLREFANVILVLGIAFTAFGVICNVVLNIALWRVVRTEEDRQLTDLCGRRRFDRSRKKYKHVRTEESESPVR